MRDLFEKFLRNFWKSFLNFFLWVFGKIFLRKYLRDFLGFFERFWKYFFEKFFCVFFEKFDFLRDLLRDFLEIFLRDFTVYYSHLHLSHFRASIYPASRLQYSLFHYLGTDERTEGRKDTRILRIDENTPRLKTTIGNICVCMSILFNF